MGGRAAVVCTLLLLAAGPRGLAQLEPDTSRVRSVLDTPVAFTGWAGETVDPADVGEVRIGYFGPGLEGDGLAGDAYRAALMAVEEANAQKGLDGTPFKLVRRWADDPWGAAAREMVHLVYRDSVWAVVGGMDGETAHLAEQVATKARLPLLSPVSADPTLTYIRIPWMFRLPPDDKLQADALIEHGLLVSGRNRIGLITSTDHDGRIFAQVMRERLDGAGLPPRFHLQLDLVGLDTTEVVGRILAFDPDGLVLRLPAETTLSLLRTLGRQGYADAVFLPWIPGLPMGLAARTLNGPGFAVWPVPPEAEGREAFGAFMRNFIMRYGLPPLPEAAYVYDAVNMVIRGLREAGLNRAALRERLTALSGYVGAAGQIRWDNAGGNTVPPRVIQIDP